MGRKGVVREGELREGGICGIFRYLSLEFLCKIVVLVFMLFILFID